MPELRNGFKTLEYQITPAPRNSQATLDVPPGPWEHFGTGAGVMKPSLFSHGGTP
jgi:hypothetical protein